MQLALVADPGKEPVQVEIVKAELFDATTKAALQVLPTRNPQVWTETSGSYAAWGGQVAPGATIKVSYSLGAPDWAKIGGGSRMAAQGKSFLLQVTLRVNGKDTTIEKEVMSAVLMIEPQVVT